MNFFSIAGFVIAVSSLLIPCFGLTGIAGLALSAIGRAQARAEKGRKGFSVAGIVIAIISILLATAENVYLLLYLTGKVPLFF